MLSVPLTGTPAVIAIVLGLGGVFLVLSHSSRRSVLRGIFMTVGLAAVAAGGALGLRDEATALALGGRLFFAGFCAICMVAGWVLRQLNVSERSLVKTLADSEASATQNDVLVRENASLKSEVVYLERSLARAKEVAADVSRSPALGGPLDESLSVRMHDAERAARQAHALGDEISDAVAVLDPESLCVRSFNRRFARLSGRARDELVGLALADLVDADVDLLRAFDATAPAHSSDPLVVRLRQTLGAPVDVELRLGASGGPGDGQLVAILRDVVVARTAFTDRDELTARIAALETEAAAHVCAASSAGAPATNGPAVSRESLDALIMRETEWMAQPSAPQPGAHDDPLSPERTVEAVAHDLRVPLTSIQSFSEILLEHTDVALEERAEFLQIIKSESQRLARMVDDLLDVRRIKSGAAELALSDVDLRDLVRDALNSLNGLALERGVTFEGTWPRTERIVRGDRDQLHRMVANLLSNAVKFSPENGVVEVILRDGETEGGTLLGVRDHGPGISEDDQAIVFERFSRGAVGSENVSGTGLGLSICREIVEVHGARLWPESRPQSGATLWVDFPAPAMVSAAPGAARRLSPSHA